MNIISKLDENFKSLVSYLQDKKAIIINGPLKYFENDIRKVDKYNKVAYLNLLFMNREIKAGLEIIK